MECPRRINPSSTESIFAVKRSCGSAGVILRSMFSKRSVVRSLVKTFLGAFLACGLLAVALSLHGETPQLMKDEPPRYWKGNLHTHSLWSDGDDFPEMIGDWYKKNGYDFLA